MCDHLRNGTRLNTYNRITFFKKNKTTATSVRNTIVYVRVAVCCHVVGPLVAARENSWSTIPSEGEFPSRQTRLSNPVIPKTASSSKFEFKSAKIVLRSRVEYVMVYYATRANVPFANGEKCQKKFMENGSSAQKLDVCRNDTLCVATVFTPVCVRPSGVWRNK